MTTLPSASGHGATITGTVVGEGARPIAGAAVEVVRAAGEPRCATTSGSDGTFTLSCAAVGPQVVRASLGELRPWQVDVELTADAELHVNFMLLPRTAATAGPPEPAAEPPGAWTRRVPNPVVATWEGFGLSLRLAAGALAGVSFLLGVLTMLWIGRQTGVETRALSGGEVADMVMNPVLPSAGDRVRPVAVAGARGASASVSYGADEMAAALAAGRYGLVVAALVVAPALFAVCTLAFAVALMVGQEAYLLYAMLLVPAGFLVTALVIGVQALSRVRARG